MMNFVFKERDDTGDVTEVNNCFKHFCLYYFFHCIQFLVTEHCLHFKLTKCTLSICQSDLYLDHGYRDRDQWCGQGSRGKHNPLSPIRLHKFLQFLPCYGSCFVGCFTLGPEEFNRLAEVWKQLSYPCAVEEKWSLVHKELTYTVCELQHEPLGVHLMWKPSSLHIKVE